MALDWNKEVSLSTILDLVRPGKKGPAGSTGMPTKTTMNLWQMESKSTDVRKVVAVGVLLFACIALFVKFGVLDQLALLSQKEAQLSEQRGLVAAASNMGADYDEVKALYDGYTAQYGSAKVDAIAVLDMVEQRVMPASKVTGIVLADYTLTLTLYDVPLDTVGNLAKDLEGQPMVRSVNVSGASTREVQNQNTVSTLVVTLVGAEEGE